MDDTTKNMTLTLVAGIAKKALITLSAGFVTHGWIASNQTETFVSGGLFVLGIGWSLWNDYGRAIVLSQLEVLKAKSLAQAAKIKDAGLTPVTVTQIAEQSPTMTPASVTKAIATLPPAVQANVAKVLLVAFVLALIALPQNASAQARRPDPIGQVVTKLKQDFTAKTGVAATGDLPFDLLQALDKKLLPDLKYGLALAQATGSKVTAPCYQAWIDLINTQQTAVQTKNADGTTTDMPLPDIHLITDFERMVELRNALQPDSDFMRNCSPVANMVKQDVVQFMGVVISGGAGLATLVPGL
jgi:hypothetical protein